MTAATVEEMTCRLCGFTGDFHAMNRHFGGDGERTPAHRPVTFVVWGGELDPGEVFMWTASQIRNSVERAHYTGFRVWEDIAWLLVGEGEIEARKCLIKRISSVVDDQDFIHVRNAIVDDATCETVAVFLTRIDGRS